MPSVLAPRRRRDSTRRRRGSAVHAVRPAWFEALEARTLLAVQPITIGSLTFQGDFAPATATKFTASTGSVLLGFAPSATSPEFHGLLRLDIESGGSVNLDTQSTSFTFEDATVTSFADPELDLPIWSTKAGQAVTWSTSLLASLAGQPVEAGASFSAKGVNIAMTNLSLAHTPGVTPDGAVQIQGTVQFPTLSRVDLSGVTARIDGGNYLIADAQGLRLTGIRAVYNNDKLYNFAGFTAGLTDVGVGYSSLGSYDDFTFSAGASITSAPDGPAGSAIRGVAASFSLTLRDGALQGFGFGTTGSFAINRLKVSSPSSDPLTFSFNVAQDRYEGSGQLTATIDAAAGSTQQPSSVGLRFGRSQSDSLPGILFEDGQLTRLNASILANFSLFGVAVTDPNPLTFDYNRATDTFELYGGLTLNFNAGGSGQRVAAALGTAASPGLQIQEGQLQQLNIGLTGQLNIYGLSLDVNAATVVYNRTRDDVELSGSVGLVSLWSATLALGTPSNPGIVIKDGSFDLDAISLDVGNVNIGAFNLQRLDVSYSKPAGQDYTLAVDLAVTFPGGWTVGGSAQIIEGRLDSIDLFYQVTTGEGIAVGDTGLYLTFLDASVSNLADPANFVIGGAASFNYGVKYTLLGTTVATFVAQGSFAVDRNHLSISGAYYAGGYLTGTPPLGQLPAYRGLLGEGTAMLDLDWGQKVYTATVSVEYYDDTIQVDGSFAFDDGGDFVLSAKAELNVPEALPFIGGDTIGSADFLLVYHADDPDNSYIAAWTEIGINVWFVHIDKTIGVEFKFGSDSFEIIGGDDVAAFNTGLNEPGNATYQYYSSYTVPAGATGFTMSVNWPQAGGTQTLQITRPDGTVVSQANFANGTSPTSAGADIGLISRFGSHDELGVHIVGSPSSIYVGLTAGDAYTLTLISSVKYAATPTFHATPFFPPPTVAAPTITPAASGISTVVPISVAGTVNTTLGSQATVTLYRMAAGGDPGQAIPIPTAVNLPVRPDALGNWTASANWETAGLFPLANYAVFARIDDGTNPAVASAPSAAVALVEVLYGAVVFGNPGSSTTVAQPGVLVYLDLNHNGVYDGPAYDSAGNLTFKGEPQDITDRNGFYSFGSDVVSQGVAYDVAIAVSPGYALDPTNPENTNPRRDVVYTGIGPVEEQFRIYRPPSLGGSVYNDLNGNGRRDPGEPGVALQAVALTGPGAAGTTPVVAVTDVDGNFSFQVATSVSYSIALRPTGNQFTSGPPMLAGTFQITTADPYPQVVAGELGVRFYATIQGSVAGDPLVNGASSGPTVPLGDWTVVATPQVGINIGGGAVGDLMPDQDLTPYGISYISPVNSYVNGEGTVVPLPGYAYATSRYGPTFRYDIPGFSPGAAVQVRLYFVEDYWDSAGQRIFDISINGTPALQNFDIFSAAGGMLRAIDRAFDATVGDDGLIHVEFAATQNNALVTAIVISGAYQTTTTDAGGNYRFDRLVPGHYVISQNVPAGWREVAPYDTDPFFSSPAVFQLPGGSSGPAQATSPISGNFLNDGGPDVAVLDPVNNVVWVYPTNFGTPQSYAIGMDAFAIVGGDFFGTGRQSIAVVDQLGNIRFLENVRSGRLQVGTQIYPGNGGITLDPPIMAVSAGRWQVGAASDAVFIWVRQENGQYSYIYGSYFAGQMFTTSAALGYAAPVAPLTFDYQYGSMVTALDPSSGTIKIFINQSQSYETFSISYPIAFTPGVGQDPYSPTDGYEQPFYGNPGGRGVFAGDINGDRLLDFGWFDDSGMLHYGIQGLGGTYTFSAPTNVGSPGRTVRSSVFRDLDGDLVPDLAWVADGDPTIRVAINTRQSGNWLSQDDLLAYSLNVTPAGNMSITALDSTAGSVPHLIVTSRDTGQFYLSINFSRISAAPIGVNAVSGVSTVATFQNVQYGQISGRVFDDVTRDGASNAYKSGVVGAAVFLDLDGNGLLGVGDPTARTDSNGYYAFDGLAPGTYRVAVATDSGRRATTSMRTAIVGPTFRAAASSAGSGAGDVDFATVAAVDAAVTIPIAARGDITILRNSNRLEVIDGRLGVLGSYLLDELGSLTIWGRVGAASTFAISVVGGGYFAVPGGIRLMGTGGDEVRFLLGPGVDLTRVEAGRAAINDGLTVSWEGVASIALATGAGSDSIVIGAATPTAPIVVDAGAGDDSVLVDAIDSALSILGGDGDDTVTIAADQGLIRVPVAIDGGAGSDTLRAGPSGSTLIGGPGDDRLFGGNGDDLFLWSEGDGNDFFDGGLGTDTLRMVTGPGGTTVAVAPSGTWASVRVGSGTLLSLLSIEELTLLPGGPDAIDVTPLAGTAVAVQGGVSGATLLVRQDAAAAPRFSFDGLRGGRWTFADAQPVTFSDLTSFNTSPQAEQVLGLYRAILGREPGAAEANAWLVVISAGATVADLARAFWESPEHRGLQVDRLYLTYLGRPADPAGRAAWTALLVAGVDERVIVSRLLASDEYRASHPTPRGFLNAVYAGVLGRKPSADDLTAGALALHLGAGRRAVAHRLLSSLPASRRIVAAYYIEILGRAGSRREIDAWATSLSRRRLTPSRVVERFLASAEFQGRFR